MEVDFTVLESELPLIKVGDKVEVTPYASAAGVRQGNISEINPLVDEWYGACKGAGEWRQ